MKGVPVGKACVILLCVAIAVTTFVALQQNTAGTIQLIGAQVKGAQVQQGQSVSGLTIIQQGGATPKPIVGTIFGNVALLRTGEATTVKIRTSNGNELTVSPMTELSCSQLNKTGESWIVAAGRVIFRVLSGTLNFFKVMVNGYQTSNANTEFSIGFSGNDADPVVFDVTEGQVLVERPLPVSFDKTGAKLSSRYFVDSRRGELALTPKPDSYYAPAVGKYSDALAFFANEVDIARAKYVKDPGSVFEEYMNALNQYGMLCAMGDKFHDGASNFADGLKEATNAGNLFWQSTFLNNIGYVASITGMYATAIDNYYLRALDIDRKLYAATPNNLLVISDLNNIGTAYQRLGDQKSMQKESDTSKKVTTKGPGIEQREVEISFSLYKLFPVSQTGDSDLNLAVKYLTEARGLFYNADPQGKSPLLETVLLNLGAAYESLKRYDTAKDVVDTAISLHDATTGDPITLSALLNNRATGYMHMGRPSDARVPLFSALDTIRKNFPGLFTFWEPVIMNNVAVWYRFNGDTGMAAEWFRRALAMLENYKSHPLYQMILANSAIK